jgi:hypothetical protein
MFYVRLRERQKNTTGRTPNKPVNIIEKYKKEAQVIGKVLFIYLLIIERFHLE